MRFILYFVCFPFITLAQDSTLLFNVQRFNLQTSSSPSSRFDQGKNVISLQTQFSYSIYFEPKITKNFLDFSYSTHINRHSFAIHFNRHATLDYLINQGMELQYAYTINLPARIFGKNTAFIPGTGLSYHKRIFNLSQFRFGDQIDDRLGFVYPTAEISPTEPHYYPNVRLSALIRSENYFLQLQLKNVFEPNISVYPISAPTGNILSKTYEWDLGLNVLRTYNLECWLTGNLFYSKLFSYQGIGITTSVFKHIMAGYVFQQGTSRITGGYYSKRFRAFIQYQGIPLMNQPFFNIGEYSAGISTAIGKQ
ncbi:MAG: hypothetical protein WCU83_11745 [Bacteroidia bacterium]